MPARPNVIFSGTSGLNNRVDPHRAPADDRTNRRAVVASDNVMADESGRVDRVPGFARASALPVHSLHGWGEWGLCVADGAVALVTPGPTLRQVTALSHPDRPLSAVRVAGQSGGECAYWANGAEKGVLFRDGAAGTWARTPYAGAYQTSREFSAAPVGDLLELWGGRMFVAVGATIYYSEPFSFGCFDLSVSRLQFGSPVTLLRGVAGGLWAGDAAGLYWLGGSINPESGDHLRMEPRTSHAPVRGAVAPVDMEAFPFQTSGGRAWLVLTAGGVCLCGPGGFFASLTASDVELRDENNHPMIPASGAAATVGGHTFFSFA